MPVWKEGNIYAGDFLAQPWSKPLKSKVCAGDIRRTCLTFQSSIYGSISEFSTLSDGFCQNIIKTFKSYKLFKINFSLCLLVRIVQRFAQKILKSNQEFLVRFEAFVFVRAVPSERAPGPGDYFHFITCTKTNSQGGVILF